MSKQILIIDAHPYVKSYCSAISESYYKGALDSKLDVKKLVIRDLKFDPILHNPSNNVLEQDLLDSQALVKWADHIVIVTPVWWGSFPASFKGFLDRAFIGGFSHTYDQKTGMPKGLLGGKTAHVIYTQGGPLWLSAITGNYFWNMVKANIGFCGIKPIIKTGFDKTAPIPKLNNAREEFLKVVYQLGKEGK